jgi:3-ketosteroid 9alpha-monooxygenase subunit B
MNMTFQTVVTDVVSETPDTVTLVLDLGGPARYKAGQYVSIDPHQFPGLAPFVGYLEHLKGRREAPRAYSMSSDPSEPLAITIKEEFYEAGKTPYPPLISGFLVHQVRPGDRMAVVGFAGAYVFPDDVESRAEHILHLCAGSGSVPNFSMIKDSLRCHRNLRHTLLYSNKTWDDVIFRDQLIEMAAQHPSRLRVVHSLTRQATPVTADADVRNGRIGRDLLGATLAAEPTSLVYACGPAVSVWEKRDSNARGVVPTPRFLETMQAELEALGLPRARLKLEAFG